MYCVLCNVQTLNCQETCTSPSVFHLRPQI